MNCYLFFTQTKIFVQDIIHYTKNNGLFAVVFFTRRFDWFRPDSGHGGHGVNRSARRRPQRQIGNIGADRTGRTQTPIAAEPRASGNRTRGVRQHLAAARDRSKPRDGLRSSGRVTTGCGSHAEPSSLKGCRSERGPIYRRNGNGNKPFRANALRRRRRFDGIVVRFTNSLLSSSLFTSVPSVWIKYLRAYLMARRRSRTTNDNLRAHTSVRNTRLRCTVSDNE